jgi:hypothetical protein
MIFYPRRGAGFAIRRRTYHRRPVPRTDCVRLAVGAVVMPKQRDSLRKRLARAIERVGILQHLGRYRAI